MNNLPVKDPDVCPDCGTRNTYVLETRDDGNEAHECLECGAQYHVAYPVETAEDLNNAVDRIPEKSLREFVKHIAHLWYVDEDGNLDADLEVNGGDAVEMISQELTSRGIQPTS